MKIDKYFHLYGRKNDVVLEEVKLWTPVTEALPKDGQAVLCTVKGYPEGENWTITDCRYKDGVWETCDEAAYDYWTELSDVIAWMPLPEPWRCEK